MAETVSMTVDRRVTGARVIDSVWKRSGEQGQKGPRVQRRLRRRTAVEIKVSESVRICVNESDSVTGIGVSVMVCKQQKEVRIGS